MVKGKKRVLITGTGGFVGDRLCEYLKTETDWDICGTSRSNGKNVDQIVNLTRKEEVDELKSLFPVDSIIHTAAIARTDECQKNRELCYNTNVVSTKNLLSAFGSVKFVLFSTYAVYNTIEGNCGEFDPVSPTNYYIETKLLSEQLTSAHSDSIIFRPSVIFGYTTIDRASKNYFMQLVDNIRNQRVMKSPVDQSFNPVHVDVICEIIRLAITHDIKGIFNIGSNESISKFEFNKKIMKRFGFDEKYLTGILSQSLEVLRPNNGTVSSRAIQTALNYTIPSLDEMIERLHASMKD